MPNWRRMAETVAILTHSASSSSWDRSSNGCQPVIVTGRLSALPFHNGAPIGSPSLLCPSPEPEPNPSPIPGTVQAIGQSVILKRPARGNGLVSGTGGLGPPPLLNVAAEPEGVFVAGSQRAYP